MTRAVARAAVVVPALAAAFAAAPVAQAQESSCNCGWGGPADITVDDDIQSRCAAMADVRYLAQRFFSEPGWLGPDGATAFHEIQCSGSAATYSWVVAEFEDVTLCASGAQGWEHKRSWGGWIERLRMGNGSPTALACVSVLETVATDLGIQWSTFDYR